MATIQKRERDDGKTSYRVLIRIKGAPTQTRTFRTLTRAKRWATRTEAAIREGRELPGAAARRVTLRELVDQYTASADFADLSAVERRKRKAQLAWWCEQYGDRLLSNFGATEVKAGIAKLTDEGGADGRPVSPATANRYRAALSKCLSMAVEDGTLSTNPCARVSARREPRGRVRRLSEDERARLLAACQERSTRLYYLVQWAQWTGARQSELMRLKWADVDEAKGRAVVHQTKSGERRSLMIPSPLLSVIAEQRRTTRRTDTDLVFAGDSGQGAFPRGAWKAALKAAEIDDFRFHDLRHDFASRMADSGASLAQLAELLGHKTLAMVKRYTHLSTGSLAGAVERMAQGTTHELP